MREIWLGVSGGFWQVVLGGFVWLFVDVSGGSGVVVLCSCILGCSVFLIVVVPEDINR